MTKALLISLPHRYNQISSPLCSESKWKSHWVSLHDNLKVAYEQNFEQVEKYVGITISKEHFQSIRRWTDDFYIVNRDLFLDRIKGGKIRDCHGDLHMEHICLTEDLPILDCIEFNDRFRYSDTIADVAFLQLAS